MQYAGDDVEMQALASSLSSDVTDYAEVAMSPMSPMALKSAYYVAESSARGRGFEGKARRC